MPITLASHQNCNTHQIVWELRKMLFNRVTVPISLISLILVAFVVWRQVASDERVAAAPLDYSVSKYSEAEWLKIARDAVHGMGMVEKPQREQWALMTRGSYLTILGGGGSPQNRDAQLFIYKGFGNIPLLLMYGGDGPARDMGGVELMFDGKTGFITSWVAFTKANVAQGKTGTDLSFIPADSGYDPHSVFPIPTAAR